MGDTPLCPACKLREKLPNNAYCLPCKAAYHLRWRAGIVDRAKAKGRRDGIEMCRAIAVGQFQQIGHGEMNGLTAAEIMRRMVVE